jgi:ABC-type bacteriocin/lantibiotic exporter with double-glycine peptidase domain
VKLQKSPNDCGPCAILNGARALGIHLIEAQIRKHTDTTDQGTTEHGIKNALERLGFESESFELPPDEAWEKLFEKNPVILAVEDGRHWVATIGVMGKRVVVFDSWMAKWNAQESGISVLSKRQLMGWWTASNKDGHRYGIPMRKIKR